MWLKDDYLVDMLTDLGFITPDQVAQTTGVAIRRRRHGGLHGGEQTDSLRGRHANQAAHFGAEVVHLAAMKIEDDVIATVRRDIAKEVSRRSGLQT